MSIQLNPTGTADSYMTLNGLATGPLSTSPGTYTCALWFKIDDPFPNGARVIGCGDADDFANLAFYVRTTTTLNQIIAQCIGNSVTSTNAAVLEVALDPWTNWHLMMIQFNTTLTASQRQVTIWMDDAAGVSTNALTSTALPELVNIGAETGGGGAPGARCPKLYVAFASWWSGTLSAGNRAQLYGSGPDAGDAWAPWLVNSANLVHAADDTMVQFAGTYKGEWAITGTNFSSHPDDNPTLVLTLGDGHARRPWMERPWIRRPHYDRSLRRSQDTVS